MVASSDSGSNKPAAWIGSDPNLCADDCPVCAPGRQLAKAGTQASDAAPVQEATPEHGTAPEGHRLARLGTLSVSGAVLAGSLSLAAGVAAADEQAPVPQPTEPTATNIDSPLVKPQHKVGDVVSAALQVGDSAALRLVDKAKQAAGEIEATRDAAVEMAQTWQRTAEESVDQLIKRFPDDSGIGKSIRAIVEQARELANSGNGKLPDDLDVNEMIGTIVGGVESALKGVFGGHQPPKKSPEQAQDKQKPGKQTPPKLVLPDLETPDLETPDLETPQPDAQPPKLDLPDLETPDLDGKPPKLDLPDLETPKQEPKQPEPREPVGPRKIDIPEIPEIKVPGVKLPKIKMPDIELPKLPDLPGMPKGELPKLPDLPKPKLPKVDLPDVKLPKAHLPEDYKPKSEQAAPQQQQAQAPTPMSAPAPEPAAAPPPAPPSPPAPPPPSVSANGGLSAGLPGMPEAPPPPPPEDPQVAIDAAKATHDQMMAQVESMKPPEPVYQTNPPPQYYVPLGVKKEYLESKGAVFND